MADIDEWQGWAGSRPGRSRLMGLEWSQGWVKLDQALAERRFRLTRTAGVCLWPRVDAIDLRLIALRAHAEQETCMEYWRSFVCPTQPVFAGRDGREESINQSISQSVSQSMSSTFEFTPVPRPRHVHSIIALAIDMGPVLSSGVSE
ncbi:hypothetical protein VFPPC_17560 [Pochonia chlamydosporia 170]|uniref:Uncharacterized protein n=1 Tax=Pochonia chlamydosporia 170 TaxID=1380566 RepID=A0A219AR71_METCM|nr:hypothetical protein VFPPC_17560 [Pochonia chlamydosporia 170]OWT43277.1 hypothetical protein VFPPC_17560 [Pochonia chlamydosporia 170]